VIFIITLNLVQSNNALTICHQGESKLQKTGKQNGLTDVQGLQVGHYSDFDALSGVTVVLCPQGAVAGVDVRGAAPGTRETDLLNPVNLVDKVHAVVLSGGSVYGLAAADGVVRWLSQKGWGFPLENGHVAPIVPSAVLYDLGRGRDFIPPVTADWGRRACQSANTDKLTNGCVGAGVGALSGAIKGGQGSASIVLETGITVAALAAVNSLGSVVNPADGRLWERDSESDNEFGTLVRRRVKLPRPSPGAPAQNTTIGVIACDAILNKAQATKIAQMAHDGLGRAIRPAHTMFDGDTLFCLATGAQPLPAMQGFLDVAQAQAINEIGHAAANCLSRAIIHAILAAHSSGQMPAFRDLEERC
jgi:L-aminopeptidase/D-esterase-like protein